MPQFKVGARVRAINPAFGLLEGEIYTVAAFRANPVDQVRLKEPVRHQMIGWLNAVRFEEVPAAPVVLKPGDLKVGDKVRIARAVPNYPGYWVMAMGAAVGNGVVYTVVELYAVDGVRLDKIGFIWPHACFELVNAAANPPAPVKPVEAPQAVGIGEWVVGAKVECTKAWRPHVEIGKVYTIQDVIPNRYEASHGLILAEVDYDNGGDGFSSSRFKIVKHEVAVPAVKGEPPKPKKPVHEKSLYAELLEKAHNTSQCSYAMEWEDGYRAYEANDVCHARIRRGEYSTNGEGKIVALVDNIRNAYELAGESGSKEYKAYSKYADYIINRSPFSIAFKPRTVPAAMRLGVEYDVSKCIHIIAGGAIALREGTEFSSKNATFAELVEKGFSEHTAFLISRSFIKTKEAYVYQAFTGGHQCFNDGINYKDAITFLVKGWKPEILAMESYAKANDQMMSIQGNIGRNMAGAASIANLFKQYSKAVKVGNGIDAYMAVPYGQVEALAKKLDADITLEMAK